MEPGSAASFFVAKVATIKRSEHIEALARMAARLAGREPDEQISLTLGQETAFEGPVWRYPDFIARAEAAYEVLVAPRLLRAEELNGHAASLGAGRKSASPLGRA